MDLSLYKEESQLKKRKSVKRKLSSSSKRGPKAKSLKKEVLPTPSPIKVAKTPAKQKPAVMPAKKTSVAVAPEPKKTPSMSSGRAERALKRKQAEIPSPSSSSTKSSPVVDHKKAKVLARFARKSAIASPKSTPPAAVPKQGKKTFCFILLLLIYFVIVHKHG